METMEEIKEIDGDDSLKIDLCGENELLKTDRNGVLNVRFCSYILR